MPAGIDQSRVTVEPPRDPAHGDMATNAAMVLAKDAGKKPRELAEAIAEKLRADDLVANVDVAGPGFINLTLKPAAWIEALRAALCGAAPTMAAATSAAGTPVNVEYVSANPTGPMHVGHCRGAVFGDALANLLALHRLRGDARILHQRCRRAGRCAGAFGVSCATAKRSAKTSAQFPRGFIRAIISSRSARRSWREHWPCAAELSPKRNGCRWCARKAIAMMMAAIRDDLAALNVSHRRVLLGAIARSKVRDDQVAATIE